MESKVVLLILVFVIIIIIWFCNTISLLMMDQIGDFIVIKKMNFFNVDENFM
jgi:hypothetical protein